MGLQDKIIQADVGLNNEENFTLKGSAVSSKVGKFARGTLALGVPGNIYDATPARITTVVITAEGQVGGPAVVDAECVGIIVNGREYVNKGSASNPLAPSLTIPEDNAVDVCTFGHIVMTAYMVTSLTTAGVIEGRVIVGSIPEDENKGESETEQQKKDYEDLLKKTLVVFELDGVNSTES